jgi:hypothetical protein
MQSDRRHLHHLIIDAGGSGRSAVLVMGALSLGFSAFVFLQNIAGIGDLGSLVILFAIAGGYLVGRRAGVKLFVGAMQGKTLAGPAE